jgi:hypothetical protein
MSRRSSPSTRFSSRRQPKRYRGAAHRKGSDNFAAKLTERDVKLARRLYQSGMLIKTLARRFRVDPSTMSLAVRGLTFRHVK